MKDENKNIMIVCMVIAAIMGGIAGLAIYSGGIYFIFSAITAAMTVPTVMDKAETTNGEVAFAVLGIFVGIVAGIIIMYGAMFVGLILGFVFSVGLGNAIRFVVGGGVILIGLLLWSLFH